MTADEIARVQAYLQTTFANSKIRVAPPETKGAPVEVYVGGEFVGTMHRDEDEGEISYSLHISILADDLPRRATRD